MSRFIVNREQFLHNAASRADSNPTKISVRKLLSYWGAKRRGSYIVDRINRDLGQYNLVASPDITQTWLDDQVTITNLDSGLEPPRTPTDAEAGIDVAAPLVEPQRMSVEATLLVGMLQSARSAIVSVRPDDDLVRAQTLMMRHDYSQLAVLSGTRDLRGAITWESIAQAQIRNHNATMQDAIVNSRPVRKSDALLALVPTIVDEGFVFVQDVDKSISGIVTTADLSNQFVDLAGPFLLLGEIERRIRLVVDSAFTVDELQAVADPRDGTRAIANAGDLTLGEHIRLLEDQERWSRLPWNLDRKIFIEILQEIKKARNEIMHFSPDPLEPDDLNTLQNFLKWIRKLH